MGLMDMITKIQADGAVRDRQRALANGAPFELFDVVRRSPDGPWDATGGFSGDPILYFWQDLQIAIGVTNDARHGDREVRIVVRVYPWTDELGMTSMEADDERDGPSLEREVSPDRAQWLLDMSQEQLELLQDVVEAIRDDELQDHWREDLDPDEDDNPDPAEFFRRLAGELPHDEAQLIIWYLNERK